MEMKYTCKQQFNGVQTFWTPAFSESWWVARNFPITKPKSCILRYTEISTFQTSQLQSIRHKVEEDDGVGMKGKGGVGGWGSGEAGAPPTSHLRNHLTPTNFPILANLITAILDMLRHIWNLSVQSIRLEVLKPIDIYWRPLWAALFGTLLPHYFLQDIKFGGSHKTGKGYQLEYWTTHFLRSTKGTFHPRYQSMVINRR